VEMSLSDKIKGGQINHVTTVTTADHPVAALGWIIQQGCQMESLGTAMNDCPTLPCCR
jgi:hypothetical protein